MQNSLVKLESKLMVVSSDENLEPMLRFLLTADGYEVFWACDLDSVLLNLHVVQPQMLLLDLHLVSGEALEILKYVRRWNPNIPVLALVESTYQDYARGCIEVAGVTSYTTKPVDYGELRKKLQLCCSIAVRRQAAGTATAFGTSQTVNYCASLERCSRGSHSIYL